MQISSLKTLIGVFSVKSFVQGYFLDSKLGSARPYCNNILQDLPKNVIRIVKIAHSETTISSRRKKDPDVTPLPPLSPDLIWSFVSGKETSKFFDVDSIESADTTGRINAQWAHSSKIRSLCLMKLSSKTFQNFLPFSTLIGTRKPTEF